MCTLMCTCNQMHIALPGAHDGVVPLASAFRDRFTTPVIKGTPTSSVDMPRHALSRHQGGEHGRAANPKYDTMLPPPGSSETRCADEASHSDATHFLPRIRYTAFYAEDTG